ncbi:MAG: glycosyltransferase, partial [Lactobacillaceae bacterium]|nr:glycosyltransferase [Lactobacillaceae bacterium]
MKKRIFFMNKGVGPTNSGVEHAEKYRYDILKKQGHYVKIILTEPGENVYKYSEDLGFERSDVISIYDYLLGASYKNPAQRQWHNMSTTWWNENGRVAVNNEEKNYFAKIDTEDYHDAYTSRADLALRFIQIFAEKENVTSDDVLIVDRGDIDAPAVLAAKLPWKIGFVVHAEHRSPDERDQAIGVMLWNNYYEFEFDHIDKYDYAITATETEKKQLEEDFAFNGNQNPAPIFAIPVGSVSKAVLDRKHVKVADREPHSLITVSRLAPEKHVDVIGNAIPLIKEKYPDVKLHVYGVGKHKEDLDKIIEEHSLQDNIILHGHSYELDEPY